MSSQAWSPSLLVGLRTRVKGSLNVVFDMGRLMTWFVLVRESDAMRETKKKKKSVGGELR